MQGAPGARHLNMDRVAVHSQRRLHDRFAQRWMRVNVAAELPRVALEQLGKRRLGDELGRLRADDVRAKHLAGLGVGDDLDEAASLSMDDGPAQRREWKLADSYFVSLIFRLLFSETYRCDLRMRIRASCDQLLLHRRHALAGDVFDRGHAFMRRSVCEEVTTDDVPDRVH